MTFKRILLFQFLLSVFFFLLQLLYSSSFLTSSIWHSKLHFPFVTYHYLFYSILSHLFLILCFSVLLAICVKTLKHHMRDADTFTISLTLWCVGTFTIFLANQYYYPQSAFAHLSRAFINDTLALCLLIISSGFFLLLLGRAISITLKQSIVFLLICLLPLFVIIKKPNADVREEHASLPNIILIGIDALRLDKIKPHSFLSTYLNQSKWFIDTETPLARTFPAWTSILTGLYPFRHGARFNLVEKTHVQTTKSLAWHLKRQGYQTLYATDERRFSQIDRSFGFDALIGPPTGVNDFIQSAMNDIPLSNLLMNTDIGKTLFPYNYMNRADYIHYFPDTFSSEIDKKIAFVPQKTPLFLAVHFTLTHWPLIWGKTSKKRMKNRGAYYEHALNAVDIQLKRLITSLKTHHRLSQAYVIVLSDHGDVLLEPHSRLTSTRTYNGDNTQQFKHYLDTQSEALDKSFGHGTDLLSPKQFQTLLAFRTYGEKTLSPQKIYTKANLIDIKPTLLHLLHQPRDESDGISLVPLMNNQTTKPRFFYSETGFNPPNTLGQKGLIDKKQTKIITDIANTFYRINPDTDEIMFKDMMVEKLLYRKQLGVSYLNWRLVLYPKKCSYIPVIINTQTGQWSDALTSPFAKKSPAITLLKKLKEVYPFLKERTVL